jgi:hypothetical protein
MHNHTLCLAVTQESNNTSRKNYAAPFKDIRELCDMRFKIIILNLLSSHERNRAKCNIIL